MKKKILLLMGVFAFGLLQAQVGVNTQSPFGVFHIDTNANTGGIASAPANDSDDFIFTTSGYVGVGTANPQKTMHVKGDMRFEDGNEYPGYLLRSTNADGDAEWSAIRSINKMVKCDQYTTMETIMAQANNNIVDGNDHYSGLSITLPTVGKWKLFLKANYRQTVRSNLAYFVVWSISRSTAINNMTDMAYSGYSGCSADSRKAAEVPDFTPAMTVTNDTFTLTTTVANETVYLWLAGWTRTYGAVNGRPDFELNQPYVIGDGFNFFALPMD